MWICFRDINRTHYHGIAAPFTSNQTDRFMTPIIIEINNIPSQAVLDDEAAPKTVKKIIAALPVEQAAAKWGDEFYFRIPVECGLENEAETVSVGDLSFWPQGNAFCIFFGKTPISTTEEEIVPTSAVNLVGRVENAREMKIFRDGVTIKILLAEGIENQ